MQNGSAPVAPHSVAYSCASFSAQVDLREYYDAGGEIKPGKKGICLSAADWATICTNEADISAAAAAGRDSYVLKLSGTRQVIYVFYEAFRFFG